MHVCIHVLAPFSFSFSSLSLSLFLPFSLSPFSSFPQVQYILHGAWDKGMTRKGTDGAGVKELWKANEPIPNWERQYGFTHFAMTLNELEECESCMLEGVGGAGEC